MVKYYQNLIEKAVAERAISEKEAYDLKRIIGLGLSKLNGKELPPEGVVVDFQEMKGVNVENDNEVVDFIYKYLKDNYGFDASSFNYNTEFVELINKKALVVTDIDWDI